MMAFWQYHMMSQRIEIMGTETVMGVTHHVRSSNTGHVKTVLILLHRFVLIYVVMASLLLIWAQVIVMMVMWTMAMVVVHLVRLRLTGNVQAVQLLQLIHALIYVEMESQ